jgi:hypothetical protein
VWHQRILLVPVHYRQLFDFVRSCKHHKYTANSCVMCAEILHQWIEIHLAQNDSFFAPDDLIFSSTDAFYELAALVLDLYGASQIQELHREINDVDSEHRY